MTEQKYCWEQATTPEACEEVFRFRYQYYFAAHEGLPGVDHEAGRVFSPHDAHSIHFLSRDAEGRLLAVATATRASEPSLLPLWRTLFNLERLAPLDLSKIVIISRLVVRPEHRNSALFGQYFLHMADYCLRHGFVHAIHYCAPRLVPLYERLGYRLYGQGVNLPGTAEAEGAFRLPMILATCDHVHLMRVRSVFRALPSFRKEPSAEQAAEAELTLRTLPELARIPLCGLSAGQRLKLVRSLVPAVPDTALPALRHAAVLDLAAGQALARADQHEGLFFVLAGSLQVVAGGCEVFTAGPGAFLDTDATACDVRAEVDTRMLVFYEHTPREGLPW